MFAAHSSSADTNTEMRLSACPLSLPHQLRKATAHVTIGSPESPLPLHMFSSFWKKRNLGWDLSCLQVSKILGSNQASHIGIYKIFKIRNLSIGILKTCQESLNFLFLQIDEDCDNMCWVRSKNAILSQNALLHRIFKEATRIQIYSIWAFGLHFESLISHSKALTGKILWPEWQKKGSKWFCWQWKSWGLWGTLVPNQGMCAEHFGRLDFILLAMKIHWRILNSGKIYLHWHFRRITP